MAARWLVHVGWLLLLCICVDSAWLFRLRRNPDDSNSSGEETSEPPEPPEQWLQQRLDHFDPINNQKWRQRYWECKDHNRTGGPVFLIISGEWPASPWHMINNTWEQYAKQYGAHIFLVEHRFYGESRPTSDMSLENLRYLSSYQALADFAHFIVFMNSERDLPKGTRWISFGCSYGGTLSAWLRYKYPHLVYGAVASSAPLLAKMDFSDYFDHVKVSLSTWGKECVRAVQEANDQLEELLATDRGREEVVEKFRLCNPIDVGNKKDVANLYGVLSEELVEAVQYDFYSSEKKKWRKQVLCDVMLNSSLGDPIDRYAILPAVFGNNSECVNYTYSDDIEKYKDVNQWIPGEEVNFIGRQWVYQSCTEFGYFSTSQNKSCLLGDRLPLTYFTQQCADVFGDKFTKEFIQEAVNRTNTMYGGLDLAATRVINVHGSVDPWHTLGVTSSRDPESPAILIHGSSHCSDSEAFTDSDNEALCAARGRISDVIGRWLRKHS